MPSDRPNGEKQYLKEWTALEVGEKIIKNRRPWSKRNTLPPRPLALKFNSLFEQISYEQHDDGHGQRIDQVPVVGVLDPFVGFQVGPLGVRRQPDVRRPEGIDQRPEHGHRATDG